MKNIQDIITRISEEKEIPRELVQETIMRFHTMVRDKVKESKFDIKLPRFGYFHLAKKEKKNESQ
ncbi:MAG: hypothetical protein EBU90_01525 [Proteobacteria bacterium]|nr:hypothetical protein [Pseudomonadota bacterium]